MQKQRQEITMHYFEDLISAMGDRSDVELPNKTKVHVYRGKVANVVIEQENREIDLSEAPDGTMLEGVEVRLLDAPHDDERDFVPAKRSFPQNEQDIEFLTQIAATIREQRVS
jgi:hypothetical protein